MDFIERVFHISPDGGSGATEWLFLLAVAVIVLAVAAWRVRPRRSGSRCRAE